MTLPVLNSLWSVAGIWVAVLGLLGLLIRQIGPWRKQITETEQRLRLELSEALEKERLDHGKDRAALEVRVEKLERTLRTERIRHNSERSLDRHRLNNITQCFDALLLLVETTPERASEIVVKIKEMRATQLLAEAEEKAIIRAAEITADECESDHDGN